MRKYDAPESVWGGSKDCEHEWEANWTNKIQVYKTETGRKHREPELREETRTCEKRRQGDTCVRCGAWRGQLGLEPSPDFYVQHLVEVFREVKRVLRSNGVFWLNIGDSYVGGQVAGSEKAFKGKQGSNLGSVGMIGRPIIPVGLKPKDLVGIPWRLAFALQADGWYLRSEIIWSKPNPMPESVRDRPTKSHEQIFLLAKSPQYFYDADAIREPASESTIRIHSSPNVKKRVGTWKCERNKDRNDPFGLFNGPSRDLTGRNKRSVWTISTQPFVMERCQNCGRIYDSVEYRKLPIVKKYRGHGEVPSNGEWHGEHPSTSVRKCVCGSTDWASHFAVFPEALVEPMVEAGCPEDGVVLDPFVGSGTVCLVAAKLNRDWIGIDISEKYCAMARERLAPYATKLEAFT